ncbi:MAG: TPR repeat protein, partial [Planctomycetota bacterium]
MSSLEPISLLLIVNAYLLLALALFALSASDLVCRLQSGSRCAKRHRLFKSIIAVPLILSALAVLAGGLFVVGLSHGSRPEDYQVILFIVACLALVMLLIVWAIGSLWLDTLWTLLVTALLGYLLFINPAIYVQYWADSNSQWAQMWMARHYETGKGGLAQSNSRARSWYKKAAENGNRDAQYMMASTARRGREALKWYRQAAELGHVGAMVQMARMGSDAEERQRWLMLAVDEDHPEALFMLSQHRMKSDLPEARRLLLDAAEKGSRTAISFLINEYRQGGVLFDRDDASANHLSAVLEKMPVSSMEPAYLDRVKIQQSIIQSEGEKIREGELDTLYRQALSFLHHPAKDSILNDRAVNYLTRAAKEGHSEAALELAKLETQKAKSMQPNTEALKWYEMAANNNSQEAMETLARFYKAQPNADTADLEKSLGYNERLLTLLQITNDKKHQLTHDHWTGEYRDTQKRIAQLARLGGSWEGAEKQAEESAEKEYLLAKELLNNRQYDEGMQHMRSAAQRNNSKAQLELVSKTLQGPRSFKQEVDAISTLQALDQKGFLEASLKLATIYQSSTGLVPRNYYLSRELLRKAQADPALAEKTLRALSRIPDFIEGLEIKPEDLPHAKIEAWYQQANTQDIDKVLLQQQYDTLVDHFREIGALENQATTVNGKAQYEIAQTLQSHSLTEAMAWLERSAKNGYGQAQYELALRMIRGKKNTAEQQQALKQWAITAADNGHVGALAFLAAQYRNGLGGFEKNTELAKDYYMKALYSSEDEILYESRIAGRI